MKRNRPDGLYAAVDLGTFAVKGVVVERRQGRDHLLAIEEEPLRPQSEFNGDAAYREHQVQAIRAIATRLPLKQCIEVAGLFNSRELQIKIAELPAQIHLDQIDAVLQFEGRKLLSPNFKQEPFILGYKVLRDSPPTVLLTCIPQSLLLRFTDLFDAAGVTLSGAYGEVFASYALRDIQEAGAIPTLAFANVGHTSTHLTIFAAGELKFYRHIPAGMSEVQSTAAAQDLDVYFQKIRFSFDYFRAVSKLTHIDEIRFFGGGAGLGEFQTHAREYFAPTRTSLPDISARLDITAVMNPGTTPAGSETGRRLLPYLPVIGALLAHFDPEGGSSDLLGRLLERRREAALTRMTSLVPQYGGAIGLFLIIAMMLFLRTGASSRLQETRRKAGIVTSTVAQLRLKQAGSRSAAGALAARMTPAEKHALRPLTTPHPAPADLLFRVSQARPDGILLTGIRILSQAEAMQDDPTDESGSGTGESDTTVAAVNGQFTTGPQTGPANSGQSSEQETNEELRGKRLEIHGACTTPEALAEFSASLVRNGSLSRLSGIKCSFASKSADRSKFVLKGELP